MKGTVYIVQEPARRNRETGDWEPSFDLTPAAAYGNLEILLPPGPQMLSPKPAVDRMRHALRNFNDDDHLLGVGRPVAMMAAAVLAAKVNRFKYKVLEWDKRTGQYISISVDVG